MPIFRAVPIHGFDETREYPRHASQRLPGNVPYLVDNLWEYGRPEGKPSRRHAVYASPTAHLALAGAVGGGRSPEDYVACSVVFATPPEVFQLSVSDARLHPDLGRLQKLVNGKLRGWSDRDLENRRAMAVLFMPGTSRAELGAAVRDHAELRGIVEESLAMMTMWSDPPDLLAGEITFELEGGNTFRLQPV